MKKWFLSARARSFALVLGALIAALAWAGTRPATRVHATGARHYTPQVASHAGSRPDYRLATSTPAAPKSPGRPTNVTPPNGFGERPAAMMAFRLPEGRDPFRLPPPPSPGSKKASDLPVYLPPGPSGLIIRQLIVQGIVEEGPQWTAVVTNRSGMAYFLRPEEALYDGFVSRITPDAVYFIERAPGSGRATLYRTVVKRLSSAQRKSR